MAKKEDAFISTGKEVKIWLVDILKKAAAQQEQSFFSSFFKNARTKFSEKRFTTKTEFASRFGPYLHIFSSRNSSD
ncbi:MAG TPA: hypothetical protein DD412_03860 [Holosporales bacterium]|nr:hypothetical protein [Holosporales bacterium]